MDKGALKRSIDEWRETYLRYRDEVIPRGPLPLPDAKFAAALIGVRRSGKTFCAVEMSKSLPAEQVFYYNFEDPLFYADPSVDGLDRVLSVAVEYASTPLKLLILDEIQNIDGWERWLRKVIDGRRYRVVLTGSSAKLLKGELSRALSGRCLQRTVWPLGYREFLTFSRRQPADPSEHRSALRAWMTWGGFPEVCLADSEVQKKRILRQYLDDLVLKDVISRHQIRDKRALDQILTYYLTNPSSLHSYHAVRKAFGLGLETVSNYTQALKDAFAVFEVTRYHPNLKVAARDPKKVYVVDTGLRNVGSRSVQDDTGKLLENLVYLELRRREHEISYFKGKFEVDFVLTDRLKPFLAVQVCAGDLSDPKVRERELRGLEEALNILPLGCGLLLTLDHEEKIPVSGGKKIEVVPVDRWLREQTVCQE